MARVLQRLRQKNHLKSPFIFCGPDGKRFYDVRRSFTTACRKAEVDGFRFHDLRHTFASQLVMNGVGLKAVQELLGHSDLKMTMRYAHLSQAHLQEAVAVLNKLGDGHQMDTKAPKTKKADNPSIANPS